MRERADGPDRRAPAAGRAGAARVRERLPAPAVGRRRARDRSPTSCSPRSPARSTSPRAAATGRSSCARSTRRRRARLRARRLGAGDDVGGPAVPRRLGPRGDHRRRPHGPSARCTRSSALERDAEGRITGVLHPREASDARVGHALRPRPPARRRGARGARRHASARCSATCAARCSTSPRWPTAAAAWCSSRARARRRYADDEVDETVAFLEWLLADHFIFLGYREYKIADDTIARRARLRPRHPRRRGVVGVRPPAAARRPARRRARARARGRPADRLQDQPALHRAPARADGLRRRPQGLARRPRHRRGADARPVHDQGLRRAGLADAAAQPQAAPDPPPRGPDRGLARLQGRGRAVRLVPQGRAVRRPHRRPAPRGRRAAVAGGRPRAAARPPLGRRPLGLADRRAARRALRRRAARRVHGAAARALRHRRRRHADGARRGRARPRPRHRPRARRRPGHPAARPRAAS